MDGRVEKASTSTTDMYSTVIFDLDGTLTSLEVRYVQPILDSIHQVLGELPAEQIKAGLSDLLSILGKTGLFLIPRSLWKLGRKLGMSRRQTISFLLVSKRNYDANRFKFKFIDGAEQSLDLALQSFNVAIVTSAFDDEMMEARSQLPQLNQIDLIVTFDDVTTPKPAPDGILAVIDAYNVAASECIYIGDLPNDIIAAKAAGIDVVAFSGTYGDYLAPLLEKQSPDYFVSSHDELQDLLRSFRS